MVNTILTSESYPAIRGLLSPEITAVYLPDTYLSLDPFAPAAEREIRHRLSMAGVDIDALESDAVTEVRLAMIYQCAAELCLTVPQMLRQSQLQVDTEVQTIDWEKKQKYHLAKVAEVVSGIIARAALKTASGRKVPFASVGTEREEDGQPAYPHTRRVYTYND